jgi:hypothetical protein
LSIVYSGPVSIGPVEFARAQGGGFEAVAPARATMSGTFEGCTVTATETATLPFTAAIEKRGDTSVWVVQLDEGHVTANVNLSGCGAAGGAAGISSAGFAGGFFVASVGCPERRVLAGQCTIMLPVEGGSVRAHGSFTRSDSITYTYTGDGTATATVKKK